MRRTDLTPALIVRCDLEGAVISGHEFNPRESRATFKRIDTLCLGLRGHLMKANTNARFDALQCPLSQKFAKQLGTPNHGLKVLMRPFSKDTTRSVEFSMTRATVYLDNGNRPFLSGKLWGDATIPVNGVANAGLQVCQGLRAAEHRVKFTEFEVEVGSLQSSGLIRMLLVGAGRAHGG